MMAVWLGRVLEHLEATLGAKSDVPSSDIGFDDVAYDEWWAPHVQNLAQLGITRGCAERRYCPFEPVTRAQTASFLVRALRLGHVEGSYFSDIQSTVDHDSINTLAFSGITRGCDAQRFCPDEHVTRGQMASFLSRSLDHARDAADNPVPLFGEAQPCPVSPNPPTAPSVIVVLKIQGCYHIVYEPIDDRTPEQALSYVRQSYQSREGFIDAILPADDQPLQSSNDPRIHEQWFLQDGQGTLDDDLNVEELWRGWREDVSIAVIDTGLEETHREFQNSLLYPGRKHYLGTDRHGHGTFVSGIIAAALNNNFAGASIAPDATIVPFHYLMNSPTDETRVLQYLNNSRIVENDNLRVVNMSYGPIAHNGGNLCNNRSIMQDLRSNKAVVLVAAAGNDNLATLSHSPASCGDLVIAVAATTRAGTRADYQNWGSNWGRYIDLAAPGGEGICSMTNSNSFNCMHGGTSSAAPVVSAIVAHLVSRFPEATAAQVETALFHAARYQQGHSIRQRDDECGRRNDEFGYGFADPASAIAMLANLVEQGSATSTGGCK